MANPYQFRSWWNAIQAVGSQDYPQKAVLYHRALGYLPGSYKIWHAFLKASRKYVRQNISVVMGREHYEVVNELYEKALVYMLKMPKIWLDYAKFLS